MTGVTFLLAIIFSVLVITRRNNGYAIGLIVFSMLIWPEYLRVPIGPANFSLPRIIAVVLLLSIIAKSQHTHIRKNNIDVLIVLSWVWTLFSGFIESADAGYMSETIGRFFDTVLMYFVARYAIQNESDLKDAYKGLAAIAIIMCIAGVVEAVTYFSPYDYIYQYKSWTWIEKGESYRLGMQRAKASTSVHIYFGMSMMLILGILWSMRRLVENKKHKYILIAALLAVLSSLSSGPWIACALLFIFSLYEKRINLIKPTLIAMLFFAAFLEVASNRHFYNLIDYLALNSQTAWYRTRLLEVAFSHLNEYWLFGVGSNMPHQWALELDGRNHIDIVNHFLMLALYGGLPTALMYIYAHISAIKRSIRAWKITDSQCKKVMFYGLSATLIALDVSSMSVSLFGPVLLLSYILLGAMVSIADNEVEIGTRKINEEKGLANT